MQQDGSDPLTPYLQVLDGNAWDLEEAERPAGTLVLRNPHAPDKFLPATESNRRKFMERGLAWDEPSLARTWLQPVSSFSSDLRKELDGHIRQAARFRDDIDQNLQAASLHAMPLMQLPWWAVLWPASLHIRQVTRVADLTDNLVEILCRQGSLPPPCTLNSEYKKLLHDCNALCVYRISGILGVHVYAVVAFVSGVQFAPLNSLRFIPLGMSRVNEIRELCKQWQAAQRDAYVYTFFTFGAVDTDASVSPTNPSDQLVLFSRPEPDGERWKTEAPIQLGNKSAVKDFIDRLKPETASRRAARIAGLVEMRLKSHRGNVDLEWLRETSQYRRSTVVEALWRLQDLGHYRLYFNEKKVLCIEPSANSDHVKLRRKTFPAVSRYAHHALMAGATEGLSLAAGWATHHPKTGLVTGAFLCWLQAFIKRIFSEHDSAKE